MYSIYDVRFGDSDCLSSSPSMPLLALNVISPSFSPFTFSSVYLSSTCLSFCPSVMVSVPLSGQRSAIPTLSSLSVALKLFIDETRWKSTVSGCRGWIHLKPHRALMLNKSVTGWTISYWADNHHVWLIIRSNYIWVYIVIFVFYFSNITYYSFLI